MSVLKRRPDRPPAAGPNDPRYWDTADLEGELKRVFQICHECRMCVGYCGTFPSIFAAVDRDIDKGKAEGAEKLGALDFARATDLCWQCKLCYIKCPYTEDEGAGELVDFPRLMAREKAQRARREGVPIVDKVLGEPGLIGKLGGGVDGAAHQLRESQPPDAKGRRGGDRRIGRVSACRRSRRRPSPPGSTSTSQRPAPASRAR